MINHYYSFVSLHLVRGADVRLEARGERRDVAVLDGQLLDQLHLLGPEPRELGLVAVDLRAQGRDHVAKAPQLQAASRSRAK